jgi:hypothetical protein
MLVGSFHKLVEAHPTVVFVTRIEHHSSVSYEPYQPSTVCTVACHRRSSAATCSTWMTFSDVVSLYVITVQTAGKD